MRAAVPLPLALSLAGCAYRPVVDPKTSRHPENYETDLAECRQLAEQGAHPGGSAAGGGAVLGGAKGAGSGENEQRWCANCMKGRGYAVLN